MIIIEIILSELLSEKEKTKFGFLWIGEGRGSFNFPAIREEIKKRPQRVSSVEGQFQCLWPFHFGPVRGLSGHPPELISPWPSYHRFGISRQSY